MAVYFSTTSPKTLLTEIKRAIDNNEITSWSYDSDGDFTLRSELWRYKAWLRPKIQNERLELFIIPPKNSRISSGAYAVYHGRFIEAVLTHCDKYFKEVSATSFPEGIDDVGND